MGLYEHCVERIGEGNDDMSKGEREDILFFDVMDNKGLEFRQLMKDRRTTVKVHEVFDETPKYQDMKEDLIYDYKVNNVSHTD